MNYRHREHSDTSKSIFNFLGPDRPDGNRNSPGEIQQRFSRKCSLLFLTGNEKHFFVFCYLSSQQSLIFYSFLLLLFLFIFCHYFCFLQICSLLLESGLVSAWQELAPVNLESDRTKFLDILQDIGIQMIWSGRPVYTLSTNNYGKLFSFFLF